MLENPDQVQKPAFAIRGASTNNCQPLGGSREYLQSLTLEPETNNDAIWMHVLAIGYSPEYLRENADGIRQDWPRIPLPDSKDLLLRSEALGRQVAGLLDSEEPVEGVTAARCERS